MPSRTLRVESLRNVLTYPWVEMCIYLIIFTYEYNLFSLYLKAVNHLVITCFTKYQIVSSTPLFLLLYLYTSSFSLPLFSSPSSFFLSLFFLSLSLSLKIIFRQLSKIKVPKKVSGLRLMRSLEKKKHVQTNSSISLTAKQLQLFVGLHKLFQ